MKKYVKPVLIFESFEMAQQIAVCQYDSSNTASDIISCEFTGVNDFGVTVTVFVQSNANCTTKAEAYCEFSGGDISQGFNIFNS